MPRAHRLRALILAAVALVASALVAGVLLPGLSADSAAADAAPIAYAWGFNDNGMLGDGTTSTRLAPVPVADRAANVTQISSVRSETVAVHADGTVWTWGAARLLGDGSTADRWTPGRVPGLPPIKQVSIATTQVLAVGTDGSLWGWGLNLNGEVGDGTTTNHPTPVRLPISGVTQAAAGLKFSMVLKSNGEVWAWGLNDTGQLGNGTTTDSLTPVRVQVPYGITQIAVGTYHGMALRFDGSVWTWGHNSEGELGDGTTTTRLAGVRVDRRVSGITQIAAGGFHSMALAGDHTIWAWGFNHEGELGDGTTTDRATPVHLALPGVTQIDGATWGSVAIDANGWLWYWGHNRFGLSATGVSDEPLTHPAVVQGITGVVTVAFAEDYGNMGQFNWPNSSVFAVGRGVIATPPPTVQVPDLIGTARTAATADIRAAGLTVGTQTGTPDDNLCEHVGEVVGQNPAAGTRVSPGTSVDFIYLVPPSGGCL
ncbi:PASTA domain-containing protein [Streptosporangiaceae bacterium NEAU-GS5]|nr:PASTA domain-containing protein [Streptosporangiaceae bacterium NEAU-GS5]